MICALQLCHPCHLDNTNTHIGNLILSSRSSNIASRFSLVLQVLGIFSVDFVGEFAQRSEFYFIFLLLQ